MAAIQPVPDINPALPDFPGPNIPESQYDDQAYAWGTAIPGYGNRIYTIGNNVYNNAQVAIEQADAAAAARDRAETVTVNALSAMNFKGDWSTLSGPLARPATVQHNNSVWLLMRDVANVAVEVPGASTAWINQTARVSSVNNRSGDVTGLTEAASVIIGAAAMSTAPLGQWATFSSTGVPGGDWPTNLGVAWWNVFTFGSSTRKTQRATQVYAGGQQGWVFERQLHDATWSIWRRVFTDQSLIERVDIRPGMTTGAITIDPATASMHIFALGGNVAANLSSPRGEGDQLTIRIYQTGSHSVTFSSNVVMPVGVTLPLISSGEYLTISLITDNNKTKWFLFVCGKHVG